MRTAVTTSAIVTAYQRIEQTLFSLGKIRACKPAPEEILVHVDGNQRQCENAVRGAFPEVKIIVTQESIGPGGGRNKLVAAARNEIVASFDDDSYPIDSDYFARALTLFEKFPAASVLCAAVFHQGEAIAPELGAGEWISDFIGCGCVYRRSAFLATDGYVPLAIAYGMEEVDLALRLHAQGGKILRTAWLRVFHHTDLQHHSSHQVTAASIANIALLTYLRYPLFYWPVGLGQILNRVRWLVSHGRRAGIVAGLVSIPRHCWQHRHFRQVVSLVAIRSYFQLRRQAMPVALS